MATPDASIAATLLLLNGESCASARGDVTPTLPCLGPVFVMALVQLPLVTGPCADMLAYLPVGHRLACIAVA